MLRSVSLYIRSLQEKKDINKTLASFEQWQQDIAQLSTPTHLNKKVLIIRLDDIGDFLLFRDTLVHYKNSTRWKGYEFTLLGFSVWKDLFQQTDSNNVDNNIWLNKNDYFDNESYRKSIWQQLRDQGFEVVICPSRVRPLLLDDMCMLAAGAPTNIGCANDFKFTEWNKVSDKLYQELYRNNALCHEFVFNQGFAQWCCGIAINMQRPTYPLLQTQPTITDKYLICFIGASSKSKRWPANRWIEFIQLYRKNNQLKIVLAGGKGDMEMAQAIESETRATNMAGKVPLSEMTHLMAHATATVSNDTMAAHLAVALQIPLVLVTNGDNFYKFSAYKEAGITGVTSVYPNVFMKKWKQHNYQMFKGYVAVTNDISTIEASTVLKELGEVLENYY